MILGVLFENDLVFSCLMKGSKYIQIPLGRGEKKASIQLCYFWALSQEVWNCVSQKTLITSVTRKT